MSEKPAVGAISWVDLTVPDATSLSAYYREVVGWQTSEIPMSGGSYADYCMHPGGTDASPVAGVCHARGMNADLPPVWLLYVTEADLDASLKRSAELGGSLITGPRSLGSFGRMAVIRDPAGAMIALCGP